METREQNRRNFRKIHRVLVASKKKFSLQYQDETGFFVNAKNREDALEKACKYADIIVTELDS